MRLNISLFPFPSRLCVAVPPEQSCRTPSGADRRVASRDELRLHGASEGVALELVPGDGLVREPQLSKGELVAEQPVGVRLVCVVRTDVVRLRASMMSTWS